jgi:hypothetical protein
MRLCLLGLCLLLCLPAAAEQRVEQDGFIVHYAAIRTTDLTPEVARQFNVRRRGKQALLVLNAQRVEDSGTVVPIAATATGRVTSLLGHLQKLDLRPVQEGPVHYVLAEFETLNREYLTVDVQLTPQGAARPIRIKFQQQFYND